MLDPVTKPTAGSPELIDEGGLKFLRDEFIRRATVITPNIPEAEFLTGITIKDVADMKAAALKLGEQGAKAVIVTGGHMERPVDVVWEGGEVIQLAGDAVKSENTHGSGCTFSSAIAAQLALGLQLREAAILAKVEEVGKQ